MAKYLKITLLLLVLYLVGFLVFLRTCSEEKTLQAALSSHDISVNAPLHFCDSTRGAKSWLWEFGNNEQTRERQGTYIFTEPGKYRVKLTVDQKYEKYFRVNVSDDSPLKAQSPFITIHGPQTALQDEFLVFKSEGEANIWRWEFGESGLIDSREKNPIYAFREPGVYEVLLTTDKNHYPARHKIEILPRYSDNDSTDVLSLIAMDIKSKLQALADGKAFNSNYNYMLSRYLCNNPATLVVVNNTKYNDFYSYCQGLKITGKSNKTAIERVVVDTPGDGSTDCLSVIYVIQNDRYKVNQKTLSHERP